MFKTVQARYALRCFLVGLGALFSSLAASTLGSDLQLGEGLFAVASGFSAALAYAGLGAAIPAVEPSIGNKPT